MIAREINGDLKLLGYISLQKEKSVKDIKKYLERKLPNYMIPVYITEIEKIPKTYNGKVDKKALPDPKVIYMGNYAEPKGEIEKLVAEGFIKILEIEKAGRYDNFFELGGHSLKATRLVNYITRTMGVSIPLSVVMKKQTVVSISEAITELQSEHNIEEISVALEEDF